MDRKWYTFLEEIHLENLLTTKRLFSYYWYLDGDLKMPIVKSKEREHCMIKAKINPQALKNIKAYCEWAGIYDFGYFIEKASYELLSQDQEWLSHQNENGETIDL